MLVSKMAGFEEMMQQTLLLVLVRVACCYLYLCTMQFDNVKAIGAKVLDLGTMVDKYLAAAFFAAIAKFSTYYSVYLVIFCPC